MSVFEIIPGYNRRSQLKSVQKLINAEKEEKRNRERKKTGINSPVDILAAFGGMASIIFSPPDKKQVKNKRFKICIRKMLGLKT